MPVQPVGDAVVDRGVYAGVKQEDLQLPAGRRVALLVRVQGLYSHRGLSFTDDKLQGKNKRPSVPLDGEAQGAVPLSCFTQRASIAAHAEGVAPPAPGRTFPIARLCMTPRWCHCKIIHEGRFQPVTAPL